MPKGPKGEKRPADVIGAARSGALCGAGAPVQRQPVIAVSEIRIPRPTSDGSSATVLSRARMTI